MFAIETRGLTKFYGKKTGCRDISIKVNRGEVFGFLGPNGAGKSTFVKMLTGLLFPSAGEAYILGKAAGDVDTRRYVGYLPENFKYQDWMTGEDLLFFHARLFKLDKAVIPDRMKTVLELVKLNGSQKNKVGTYSKGMQQRIGIACALLPDPEILFLDEPSSALDPVGRKDIRNLMVDLKNRGKTVFLNSHLLSEVEMICDSIAIVNKGTIIKEGDMESMLQSHVTLDIRVEGMNPGVLSQLKKIDPNLQWNAGKITMRISDREEIPGIADQLVQSGCRLYEITPHGESLEQLFINLVEGSGD